MQPPVITRRHHERPPNPRRMVKQLDRKDGFIPSKFPIVPPVSIAETTSSYLIFDLFESALKDDPVLSINMQCHKRY